MHRASALMHTWRVVRWNWHGQLVGTSQNHQTTSFAPQGLLAYNTLKWRLEAIATPSEGRGLNGPIVSLSSQAQALALEPKWM